MKLKEYSTPCSKVPGMAIISFKKKAGVINVNKATVEALKLSAGDRLVFFQDEDNPEDWYMKVDKEKGALLRNNTSGGGMTCNFSQVAAAIVSSTGRGKDRVKFQLSTVKENEMYAIITRKNLLQ